MPDSVRRREFVETGGEPDYQIDAILEYEMIGNGAMVRLYCGQTRRNEVRMEYSVHITPEKLIEMARQIEEIAAEALNLRAFSKELGKQPPGKNH